MCVMLLQFSVQRGVIWFCKTSETIYDKILKTFCHPYSSDLKVLLFHIVTSCVSVLESETFACLTPFLSTAIFVHEAPLQ